MQDNFEKIKDICLSYRKYIGAFVLFIAFVVVLSFCNGSNEDDMIAEFEETESEEFEVTEEADTEVGFVFQDTFDVDSKSEMKELLESYYSAYTSNDVAALEQVAYPLSENEKSYIEVLSKYYDKIEKFTYYSKTAAKQGAYFVSVENQIAFDGVKTKAPALDFFYVETDENGKLFINNAYSIFNLNFMDNKVDSDIYALVQEYMQQPDFIKLQQKVQSEYDEALSKDSDLAGVVQKTLDSAIKKWSAELQASALKGEASEVDEQSQKTDDKKEDAKADDEKTKSEQEKKKTKVTTKDVVNVRKSPSVDSDQLGQFSAGAELTKLGEDGEWTIIEFQNGKGYVKTEFLQ